MDLTPLIMISAGTFATNQTFTPFPAGGGSLGGLLFFLVIVALVVVRRIRYAVRGRRYSTGRVLSYPVIYMILTLALVVSADYQDPTALLSLLAIPAGFPVGYVLGRTTSFFNQGGTLFFKRSPFVLIIWMVSYIGRLFILIELGSNFEIGLIFDTILAGTTGVLIGEALRVIQAYRKHTSAPQESSDSGNDEQVEMMKEL